MCARLLDSVTGQIFDRSRLVATVLGRVKRDKYSVA